MSNEPKLKLGQELYFINWHLGNLNKGVISMIELSEIDNIKYRYMIKTEYMPYGGLTIPNNRIEFHDFGFYSMDLCADFWFSEDEAIAQFKIAMRKKLAELEGSE